MSKSYPKELIEAFRECRKQDWSEKAYEKYAKIRKEYLKSKDPDPLEQSKITLELSQLLGKEELVEEFGADIIQSVLYVFDSLEKSNKS